MPVKQTQIKYKLYEDRDKRKKDREGDQMREEKKIQSKSNRTRDKH